MTHGVILLMAGLLQAGRPAPGPAGSVWIWASPGLAEVVAPGPDAQELILSLLSSDMLPRRVLLTALDAKGSRLGQQECVVQPASILELPLEALLPADHPGPARFTLIVSGLEISPAWLVPSLRCEESGRTAAWPPGQWVQADPLVARRMVGRTAAALPPGAPGGS
jgi:hypothetical protein